MTIGIGMQGFVDNVDNLFSSDVNTVLHKIQVAPGFHDVNLSTGWP